MSFFDQLGALLAKYDVLGAFMTNIELTFWAAIGSFVIGTVLALMRILSLIHISEPTRPY